MSTPTTTTPTAEDLFRLTDDGAGGSVQTAKRRLKFRLRYLLCRSYLEQVRNFFTSHDLQALTHEELPLMLRPMRSYLWRGLNVAERTQAQLAFFNWFIQRCGADAIQAFYKCNGFELFSQTYPEGCIRVVLIPARALGREGELEMHLKLNEVSVMKTSFTVLPATFLGEAGDGWVMVIGNMQGQRSAHQEIKIVTQKMERTRPQNILMTALQGLASGWELSGIAGVTDSAHVYAGYRSLSQRVGQSYDALWEELGFTRSTSKTHWACPVQWVARSEQEVPSNKRSQLRRKNEIRQRIFDQVAHNSAGLQTLHCSS